MTHSENIKTFVDISQHLELEAECLGVLQGLSEDHWSSVRVRRGLMLSERHRTAREVADLGCQNKPDVSSEVKEGRRRSG